MEDITQDEKARFMAELLGKLSAFLPLPLTLISGDLLVTTSDPEKISPMLMELAIRHDTNDAISVAYFDVKRYEQGPEN